MLEEDARSEEQNVRSEEQDFSYNGSTDSAFMPSEEEEDARSEGELVVSSDGVGEDEEEE